MSKSKTDNLQLSRPVRIPDKLRLARYKKIPELGPRILFFSGGTALNPLSKKLIDYTHNSIHLVTPFDSGGSSAVIRQAFDMISVGDLRSRLMALADQSVSGNPDIYRLFSYRFPEQADNNGLSERLDKMIEGTDDLISNIFDPMRKIIRNNLGYFRDIMPRGFDLRGASIGNLILAGGYHNNRRHIDPVIYMFGKLVEARGIVRTVTGENLHLAANLENGETIIGQRNLTGKETDPIDSKVEEIYLVNSLGNPLPVTVTAREKILQLISDAELICFPMGSFYSSVIANLLPQGIPQAICKNKCPKVYIPNTGKDPEQYGISTTDCVEILLKYLMKGNPESTSGSDLLNVIITDTKNSNIINSIDKQRIREHGIGIIDIDLAKPETSYYIDENLLLKVLLSLV